MLEVSPVRAFSDNYIWLIRTPADRCGAVAVDPGDAGPVDAALARHGLRLHAILVTHHHPDHVGGVAELAAAHGAQVYGPARESLPCEAIRLVDGDTIPLPDLGLEFMVMDVPGHTLGHIAYHGHEALFCGDTLFSGGCGRLFEGSPAQMLGSLDRMAALPASTRVFCAHEYTLGNLRFAATVEPGNAAILEALEATRALRADNGISVPSTIGRELRINPFLRCRQPSVRAAAEAYTGRSLDEPVEIFAAVRTWKDGFR
jgi:hydroxyacylglutathione hydrolase